jgi:hypothetical protein
MFPVALDVQRMDYLSDLGAPVTAWRAFTQVQFVTTSHAWVPGSCLVDSGAPFSIIPYSQWHDRDLDWKKLGSQLTRQGQVVAGALEWQGEPCDLGATRINLVDPQAGTVRGPFPVVGKFPRRPHPRPELEKLAILGLNFLTDNYHSLGLDGGSGDLLGSFSVP